MITEKYAEKVAIKKQSFADNRKDNTVLKARWYSINRLNIIIVSVVSSLSCPTFASSSLASHIYNIQYILLLRLTLHNITYLMSS